MSMPANKSDGPKSGGKLEKIGHPDTKYNHEFMNPSTMSGQPACREEVRKDGKMKEMGKKY